MKLATVITLSSLLTGCAVAADDVELDRAFPEGAEVVVLYADDLADFGVADHMARPEFPRDGDQLVAEDQASDRRIVPGTPSIPDREVLPHGGDKLGLAGHGAIIIAHPKPASSLDQAQFPRHGIDTVAAFVGRLRDLNSKVEQAGSDLGMKIVFVQGGLVIERQLGNTWNGQVKTACKTDFYRQPVLPLELSKQL